MGRLNTTITGLLLLLICTTVTYAADPFTGTYQEIRPAQPTHSGDKIEVVEIFWYGCPHCYTFEPYLEKWLASKPDDVEFRRLPGILGSAWTPHARAYFTAEKMGILDQIHEPLFSAIHNQRKQIFNDKELKKFIVTITGVDGDEFSRIFDSKEIDIKMRQTLISEQKYRITGVPAVIVNGKYLTNGTLAKSYEAIIDVIDHLVDMERQRLARK